MSLCVAVESGAKFIDAATVDLRLREDLGWGTLATTSVLHFAQINSSCPTARAGDLILQFGHHMAMEVVGVARL